MGLGLENPAERASFEHAASLLVTAPLVTQIISQAHEPPDYGLIRSLQLTTRRERDARLNDKSNRAVELAAEKGASGRLTVMPVKEIDSRRERI